MKVLRVSITLTAVCLMSAAIGAVPNSQKSPVARVAPRVTTPSSTGSNAVKPSTDPRVPDEADQAPLVDPTTESAIPEVQVDVLSPAQVAGAASGAPVNMDWYSINNGGAIEVAAGNIKMGLSIGQNAVGEVSAGNIKMGLGFWYGATGATSPTCACDCAADPVCDNLTDVFDVTQIVNVAFRNGDPIPDSNVLCPWVTTDVNCDGVTDVFDVTRIVNVAFRDGDPASEFCDPCSLPL